MMMKYFSKFLILPTKDDDSSIYLSHSPYYVYIIGERVRVISYRIKNIYINYTEYDTGIIVVENNNNNTSAHTNNDN